MRTLFHNKKHRQINFLDSRYYTNDNNTFYPSVTTILSVYPKGFGFENWLKDVGHNAKVIANKAADFGSTVHNLTEIMDQGVELHWVDDEGKENYPLDVWKSLLAYRDFHQQVKPEVISNEENFCSEALEYGGTLDRVMMIYDRVVLIDIKTSNAIRKTYWMQICAYKKLWEEVHGKIIDDIAVLWLKAKVRTSKVDHEKAVYQGAGDFGAWQLCYPDKSIEHYSTLWDHTHAIWREENPNYKPHNLIFTDTIKL